MEKGQAPSAQLVREHREHTCVIGVQGEHRPLVRHFLRPLPVLVVDRSVPDLSRAQAQRRAFVTLETVYTLLAWSLVHKEEPAHNDGVCRGAVVALCQVVRNPLEVAQRGYRLVGAFIALVRQAWSGLHLWPHADLASCDAVKHKVW